MTPLTNDRFNKNYEQRMYSGDISSWEKKKKKKKNLQQKQINIKNAGNPLQACTLQHTQRKTNWYIAFLRFETTVTIHKMLIFFNLIKLIKRKGKERQQKYHFSSAVTWLETLQPHAGDNWHLPTLQQAVVRDPRKYLCKLSFPENIKSSNKHFRGSKGS